MDRKTAAKLISLNSEFYQTFASQFSSTRMRLQPGVMQILDRFPLNADILDLGCGNGEIARELIRRDHRGTYMGIDFSPELLNLARRRVTDHPNFHFFQADISTPNWFPKLANTHTKFKIITAFAALHHIPSRYLHLQLLNTTLKLIQIDGCFIHSNWQFLNSEKLRSRIQQWSEIGLTETDVEGGDYLLDWRQGGRGLRYVHHFSEDELSSLASETHFEIIESFYSDGDGGNLGLYQIWKPTHEA